MTTQRTGAKASELISRKITTLGDWRGATLARMRTLIHQADPDVVEELKWMGTPVWSHDGIVCTGEVYNRVVKLTFARGAFLKDPKGLFNSSLEGNLRRAIDLPEGAVVDAAAFVALFREAVTLNVSDRTQGSRAVRPKAKTGAPKSSKPSAGKPRSTAAKSAVAAPRKRTGAKTRR